MEDVVLQEKEKVVKMEEDAIVEVAEHLCLYQLDVVGRVMAEVITVKMRTQIKDMMKIAAAAHWTHFCLQ